MVIVLSRKENLGSFWYNFGSEKLNLFVKLRTRKCRWRNLNLFVVVDHKEDCIDPSKDNDSTAPHLDAFYAYMAFRSSQQTCERRPLKRPFWLVVFYCMLTAMSNPWLECQRSQLLVNINDKGILVAPACWRRSVCFYCQDSRFPM
jgi:hypothetical protein